MAQNGSSVGQHAERAHPWIERLARFGYVAYGVVYLLVGVLSVQAALGLVAYGVFMFVVARYRGIEPAWPPTPPR